MRTFFSLRDMLQNGGSAVDGAIAALLCTSLLNVQSLSLGGGTVITVMDSSGEACHKPRSPPPQPLLTTRQLMWLLPHR